MNAESPQKLPAGDNGLRKRLLNQRRLKFPVRLPNRKRTAFCCAASAQICFFLLYFFFHVVWMEARA